uniref:Uncharacterized protein n=1 Tax=Halimeda discoidea TaxID=118222 RepID=A0A1C9JB58_9CHLO|nr:hypothetical protein [Halimeda discoidea]
MNPNLLAAVTVQVAMHLLQNNQDAAEHPAPSAPPFPQNGTWWNFFVKVSTGIFISRPRQILSIPFKVVYKMAEWLNVIQPSVQHEQLSFMKMNLKTLSTSIPMVKKNFNYYDLIFVISKKKLDLIVNIGIISVGVSVVTIRFLIKKYNASVIKKQQVEIKKLEGLLKERKF